MHETYLESTEDLEWLRDVHGIDIDNVACAILYGNEDWPDTVETYSCNHIDATVKLYRSDINGIMYQVEGS